MSNDVRPKNERCKDCRWFIAIRDSFTTDDIGWCVRSAPTTYSIPEGRPERRQACWPSVDREEWCGEFEPSPDSPCNPGEDSQG